MDLFYHRRCFFAIVCFYWFSSTTLRFFVISKIAHAASNFLKDKIKIRYPNGYLIFLECYTVFKYRNFTVAVFFIVSLFSACYG